MSMRARTTDYCQGSAALAIHRSQLRVIEGGLSNATRQGGRAYEPAEVTPLRKPVRKESSYHHVRHSQRAVVTPARNARSSIAIGAICLCLMIALGLVWHSTDVRHARSLQLAFENVAHEHIVVMPGDTLWAIAEQHPVAGCTTQEVVRHIEDDNGLSSAFLQGGMVISVPLS